MKIVNHKILSELEKRCNENGSTSATLNSATSHPTGSNYTTATVSNSMDGQLASCDDDLCDWTQTYHMRTLNLLNFPTSASSNRVNYRTVMNRARIGIITSSAKSLNVLRQALQNSINNEINQVMQKYVDKFFRPSITNIKKNFGNNSVSDQHLQAVCRQILEEAKKMYVGPTIGTAANSPLNGELIENGSDYENNGVTIGTKRRSNPPIHQLLDCESDSESSSLINNHIRPPPIKKKKLKGSPVVGKVKAGGGSGSKVQIKGNHSDYIKREGPRWDSNRLSTSTKFVLGSKANKALGFGATRGRLYTKHADLFRYIGDQEDKEWLHKHGLMPPAGGKAYLIIKEDIEDLLISDEYRDAPGVDGSTMGAGFTVPDYMIEKMKGTMESMKAESARAKSLKEIKENSSIPVSITASSTPNPTCEASSDVGSSNSNQPSVENDPRSESRGASPAPATDDLDYLNSNAVPSGNPSPFSLIGTSLSPNQEIPSISPLPTDLSLNSNDM